VEQIQTKKKTDLFSLDRTQTPWFNPEFKKQVWPSVPDYFDADKKTKKKTIRI